MRCSFISAAFLALSSGVFAQTAGFDAITAPFMDQNVAAGSTFDILWDDSSATHPGTITIKLLQGASPSTLSTGPVVADSVAQTTGKYSWTVPTNLTNDATFGFAIYLDSNTTVFQYSFPFHITGLGSTSTVITGSSSSVSATSTKTVSLSTGTAYVSSTSSSLSASSTLSNFTVANSTTSTSASSTPVAVSTSNITVHTSVVSKTSTAAGSTVAGSSSATSPAATATSTGGAAANAASAGLAAFGGLVIAFAL